MKPQATAIFVTYNSEATIGAALGAFKDSHDRNIARCVVVDNASTDRSAELVRTQFPWVRLIESRKNLGYGSALNLGMRTVDSEFVSFMNADACLPRVALEALLRFLREHPRAAMAGPAMTWGPEDRLQETGALPTPRRIVLGAIGRPARLLERPPIEPGGAAFPTDWLCGAILVARTAVIREVGGFDERFFLYYEETDLCRRLIDRGWELWAVGEAVAQHGAGGSARESNEALILDSVIARHFYASRYKYLKKHHGGFAAVAANLAEIAILAVKDVLSWLVRRPSNRLSARLLGPVFGSTSAEVRGTGTFVDESDAPRRPAS